MDEFLFDQNPSPMLIFDMDSLQILKANKAFYDKYKYSSEDIEEGLSLKKISPEEDVPNLMEALKSLRSEETGEPKRYRHKPKEGDVFHVKITSRAVSYEDKNAQLMMFQDITEQIAAEQELAQTSEELHYHIAKNPLATIRLDPELKILDWSQRAEEISGFSKDEVLGKNIFKFDFFDETERERFKGKVKDLMKSEREQDQFETEISRKNGSNVHLKVHSSVRRGPSDEVQSVLSFVEDITGQKKSEIKYQRLFDNAHDSIFILKDEQFEDCNKKAEALLKTTRENITGKSFEYFSPDEQPEGVDSLAEAKKRIEEAQNGNQHIFEWQLQDTEGNLIDVEVSLDEVIFPDGNYLQAILRDITQKRKIEAELRKNEELFRNLFLKSPAALVMVDINNQVQLVNERFEEMFGYKLNEITGKNIDLLIVPPEELDASDSEMKSYIGSDFRYEGVRLTKEGKKKDVILAGMPVYVDDEPVAGLGAYIDITDRKQKENQVIESLDEKKFLLGEIHHRIKNNLAAVSGFVQLQSYDATNENIEQALNDIQLQIKSVGMIHQLLYQSDSFSRILLDDYINQLLAGMSDIFAFDENQININTETEEAYVSISQAIPCAMLINELVTNAYKHAFNDAESGAINIVINRNDDRVYVEVSDDGSGLPNDFGLKGNGSLGMDLIDTLTDQLNADLTYDSSSEGAVFRFSFISEIDSDVKSAVVR